MRKLQAHPFFKFLASLNLAVFSILMLAAVLAVATVLESWYGMRGAHLLVYGRAWFYGVLGILAINVLCAALSRYPWKKHQTGFVVTHSGILVVLFGSWLTMQYGVDGSLPVVEGQDNAEVLLHDLELWVGDSQAGRNQVFRIPESAFEQKEVLRVDLPRGDALVVEKYLPRATISRRFEPAASGIGTPAVHVELANERFQVDEWLMAMEPDRPSELNLGPAVVSFQKLWTPAQERDFRAGKLANPLPRQGRKGYVVVGHEGKQFRVDIDEGMEHWVPLESAGLQVRVDRYLPYAVVERNALVNRGDDPVNPTVQIRLRDTTGTEERHTLFANFPDFATLHKSSKRANRPEFPVHLRMIASEVPGASPAVRGRLFLAQSPDNQKLLFRITGRDSKVLSQGELIVGQEIRTGWMDLRLRIPDWYPAANALEEPKYLEKLSGGSDTPPAAIQVQGVRAGVASAADRAWLVEGTAMPFVTGDRMLEVAFGRDRLTLPFRVELKKFHMAKDPGTQKAASYESDVGVRDVQGTEVATAHISMNEPMHHGGYTFYQASYQLREGQPAISVFSVNYDPGRIVKYAGSLILVLGVVLMFTMNPHYWGILFGLGKKR